MNYDKIRFFSPKVTLVGAVGLLLVLLGFLFQDSIYRYYYNAQNCDANKKKRYLNFNTPVPRGYSVYGMDISHYQCAIDWEAVARMNGDGVQMRFAFVRATRGSRFRDMLFAYNWNGAKAARLIRGAYHFFYANEDAQTQARNFLQTVRIDNGDLPPVLDVENGIDDVSDAQILAGVNEWLRIVEAETGVRPIIYCNVSYYNRLFANGNYAQYPFWIARYADNQGQMPRAPALRDGRQWHFWQFSESANINGISERADLNVFAGNYEQLKAMLKK